MALALVPNLGARPILYLIRSARGYGNLESRQVLVKVLGASGMWTRPCLAQGNLCRVTAYFGLANQPEPGLGSTRLETGGLSPCEHGWSAHHRQPCMPWVVGPKGQPQAAGQVQSTRRLGVAARAAGFRPAVGCQGQRRG